MKPVLQADFTRCGESSVANVAYKKTKRQNLIAGMARETTMDEEKRQFSMGFRDHVAEAIMPNLNSLWPSWTTACAVFMRASGKSIVLSVSLPSPRGS
jgi:pyruvate dehydrogenase complex dehydrogenase (E1) component